MSDHTAREALTRMNGREVAIAPLYATIEADLRMLSLASHETEHAKFMARRGDLCAAYGLEPGAEQRKPFAFSQGIAIIPISGTLINRFGSSYGYVTGYNFIRGQVAAAMMDDDVTGIVYDVNTYGGEAAGCFECAADLKMMTAGKKPTIAVIDSNCYSAGMALASAADKRVCTPSGGAGSVGVVAMHIDVSKMLADFGVKVTFIHAGDHKVDGNPYEPLPKSVQASMQKNINKSYDAFVSLIATNLGMDEKAVRATQAECYRADDALEVGFIDAIESPNTAVRGFFSALSGATLSSTSQEPAMDKTTTPGAAEADAQQAAVNKASADARTAERTRISGIQGCDEAKGREGLASHLALNTDMSVDTAKGVLAAAPKAEAAKPAAAANPLAAAMDATGGGPKVGADGGGEADAGAEKTDEDKAQGIMSAYGAATGRKMQLVK